jgi:GntR family transcriptional regulator, arabinose operon transcriptional repressor
MTQAPKIKISHESVEPLHAQLSNQLRELIKSGEYQPGMRLPSELQLQRDLNISRSTIRQALLTTERDGLIERIPGKGTFVTRNTYTPSGTGQLSLGFVTCEFDNGFEHNLLKGAESVAREHGYQVVFSNTHSDAREEARTLDQMQMNEVAGVVLWSHVSPHYIDSIIARANGNFPPLVMMDRTIPGLPCDYVTSDNLAAGRLATQHLLDLGHRRIVFVSHEVLTLGPVADRMAGYRETMRRAGLVPLDPWIVYGDGSELTPRALLNMAEDAEKLVIDHLVNHLRDATHRPTAIFAVNDYVALLTLRAAHQAGLCIPDDLSIVGVDDAYFAAYMNPALTTIAQDTYSIGQRSMQFLIERVQGYSGPPRREMIPVELRVRATTCELPEQQH